jgi:hypothetical protein
VTSYENTEITSFKHFSSKRKALGDETKVYILYFIDTSSAAKFMKWVLILSSYEKEMATENPSERVTKMEQLNLT